MRYRRCRTGAAIVRLLIPVVLCIVAVYCVLRMRGLRSDPPPSAPVAKTEEKSLPLNEKERTYIWDCEHHGQEISQRGLKILGAAIQNASANHLRKILPADFKGGWVQESHPVRLAADYAEIVRHEDQGQPMQSVGRDEFIARILKLRGEIAVMEKLKFSLLTLSPVVRYELAGPWEGSAVLWLAGRSAAKGPVEIVLNLRFGLAQPSKALFDTEGWLKKCSVSQSLVGRAPKFMFREVAGERGIHVQKLHDNWKLDKGIPQTGGVYLCDYDRDGILDLLITDLEGNFFYKGLPGGKFRDVTEQVSLPRSSADFSLVCFADLDGDGWDDLILGDRIFQNRVDANGDRYFYDVTSQSNLRIPSGYRASVCDYDRDGKLDLYLTSPGLPQAGSWITGTSGDSHRNYLWRNKGDWKFEDVTEASGTGGGNRSTFTSLWLDVNNDAWPDVYVPNEFGRGALFVNQGNGTFREQMLSDGPDDFGTMGATCGDVSNSGNIDLYVANMYSKAGTRVMSNLKPDAYPPDIMALMRRFVTGSQLWHNTGDGRFEQKGKQWQVNGVGWAYGPALVDLDNDGFLDIYANAGFISRDRSEPDG